MTIKKFLFVFSILPILVFTSCQKEEETETPPVNQNLPEISINGITSGNLLEIPQISSGLGDFTFQNTISNLNIVSTFIEKLNNIPKTATTVRSTNSISTTYHWTATLNGNLEKYWYTVVEDGNDYSLTYDVAISGVDTNTTRTKYFECYFPEDGFGHLIINYALAPETVDDIYYYTYHWETDEDGIFYINSTFDLGPTSENKNILYETKIMPSGGGEIAYSYKNSHEDNIRWDYEWDNNWYNISYDYSLNNTLDTAKSGNWQIVIL